MHRKEVEERSILLGLAGSRSYGTYVPGSDWEYKGICIASKQYYLGFKNFEQKDGGWQVEVGSGKFPELNDSPDSVIYELRKYIALASNNNPNILELLWLDRDQYLWISPIGEKLLNHRELFLSKKVKHSFLGYALSQIKRVESHRRWLLDPPAKAPEPADFGLENHSAGLSKEDINAFLEFLYLLVRDRIEWMEPAEELRLLLLEKIDFKGALKQHPLPAEAVGYAQELTRSSKEFIHLLQISQQYRNAMNHWKAYQDWLKGRNPERRALEMRCGYDSKHASHCLRLLKMGIEILETGELVVNRERAGDAEYLRAIRLGDYPYEHIKAETEQMFAQLDQAYESSSLPRQVNHDKINDLCIELVEMYGF